MHTLLRCIPDDIGIVTFRCFIDTRIPALPALRCAKLHERESFLYDLHISTHRWTFWMFLDLLDSLPRAGHVYVAFDGDLNSRENWVHFYAAVALRIDQSMAAHLWLRVTSPYRPPGPRRLRRAHDACRRAWRQSGVGNFLVEVNGINVIWCIQE